MKTKQICKRCHRLRAVNNARLCEACEELRKQEERRPPPPKATE